MLVYSGNTIHRVESVCLTLPHSRRYVMNQGVGASARHRHSRESSSANRLISFNCIVVHLQKLLSSSYSDMLCYNIAKYSNIADGTLQAKEFMLIIL